MQKLKIVERDKLLIQKETANDFITVPKVYFKLNPKLCLEKIS